MVTVRHALKMGGLASSKLVAGYQGLDNKIFSVDIIEVPDFQDWARPNVLAVTCGYAVRDDTQSQKGLVLAMAQSKAAALAVKPGRFLGESMPEVMIRAADEKGLPLIEVPVDIPYTKITLPVLSAILNEQVSRLQYASSIHEILIRSVIENQGIESIAETVSHLVGSQAYIVDLWGRPLAFSHGAPDHARIKSFLRKKSYLSSLEKTDGVPNSVGFGSCIDDFLCIPAVGKGGVLGYLILDRDKQREFSVFEETAFKESVTVIVLELTKRQIIQETEMNMKRRFLQEHGFAQIANSAQAVNRALLLGLSFDVPYVVIVAKAQEAHDESGSGCTQVWSKERLESVLDWVKVPEVMQWLPISLDRGKDELTLLCSGVDCAGEGRLSEFTINGLRRFRKNASLSIGTNMLFGVSRVHTGTRSFTLAEEEARKAIAYGYLDAISDRVFFYHDMTTYEFINHIGTDMQARFARDNLQLLLNEAQNLDLVKTLRVFLQCGGQVTQTAKSLFIHRNTLNYRLEKISSLLGCDVKDVNNRFRLKLAFLAGLLSGVVQE